MKLTTLMFIVCIMQVSASTFAQKVTLSEKNAPLKAVFDQISQQTGYDFIITGSILQQAKPVTLDVKNEELTDALDQLFAGQPLSYELTDKSVLVKVKEADKPQPPPPPANIIGRVTNTAGQPLDGASVIIKRTQSGVLTNPNGVFKLSGVYPADTLYITYIGYTRAVIRIGNESNIKVILKEATNSLDQVVIQAYGETTQRTATGDIGTVTAKQIEKQPVMNVLEALQGQVPGAVVTNTSGYTSGAVKVEIRGRNTIGNFPSDPLYVIDGVPLTILDLTGADSYQTGTQGMIQSGVGSPANGQSPMFGINPADIESISVLKDADATAIYGSRGSNGVIIITTKKGKAGKTHLDVSLYSGYKQTPTYQPLLNTAQYIEMRKEALANDGLPLNVNTAPDVVLGSDSRYTDWEKYVWGHIGKTTDATTTLSGGDAQNTFRIAAGYHYETEILTVAGANQRGNMSFNFEHHSIDQKFSVVISTIYSHAFINIIANPANITTPPNAPPVFNSNGELNFAGWDALGLSNPFGSLLQPYNSTTDWLNTDLSINYQILKGFKFHTNLGYGMDENDQSFLTPIASQDPIYNPTGTADFGHSAGRNLIIEPQLQYNTLIGKGKLDVLAGGSYQYTEGNSILLVGYNYDNDALLNSVSNTPDQIANNLSQEYKYVAAFARVTYNWKDELIFNLNARRDGSTKFGPGRQFGDFGSVGAAWIFSEETLVQDNLPFLSLGKLRASYGTTGGDQIPPYSYLSQWAFSPHTYNNIGILNPAGHTDSLIHWEVNKKLELAFDLGFFKDRLLLDVSWYRNRCSDQLVSYPTPSFTGFTSVTTNLPAVVQNNGLEITFNAKAIKGEYFGWSAKFTIGSNSNKLIAYPNLAESPYSGRYIVGQSLNILRVLHFTGVDPLTGQYTFEDKNHDGQITFDQSGRTSDDSYPVNMSPKFDGGVTNEFSYKNWSLSLFFYFKKQLGYTEIASLDAAGDATNQPDFILSRWQYPGQVTNVAKFTTNPGQSFQDYQLYSDAAIGDASFIRLQNASLSYTLPATTLKKFGAGSCRVYLQGENLLLFSKYRGLDPEVQNFYSPPRPRIVTAGFSCNF